ncbi:hypothetical protein [Rhizobium leguminosarum]|uniref:hypothetical protein n=1 Tax=Rhizobium leguminosarum TaxID=384 RepID=UPI00103DA1E2|nr:hypothetical protein [Rhizobium leguminosarum]TCA57160.1 hypothetical protein E0H41_26515 [Rhizobium leguminosarum bv. viciae]TCB22079.1 hypothetical protein E0J09_25855 [Rhizobium leguminosarum bv. viciae]
MTKRSTSIQRKERKKRRVFNGSLEQRLRARMDALGQLQPDDITEELWEKIETLEALRTWESEGFGIEPIGSKRKYTTTNADFGGMLKLLQLEIDRLRPPPATPAPKPRKTLAVQLAESKAVRELLDARLDVFKKDVRRLAQDLGKNQKTVRAQGRLIEHYEQKIDLLTRENSNLKMRLLGFERLAVVP